MTERNITVDGELITVTLDQAKEWNADSEKTCYVCDTFGISLIGYDSDGWEIDQMYQCDMIESTIRRLLINNDIKPQG